MREHGGVRRYLFIRGKLELGRRTGRSLPVALRKHMSSGGGKSELRRAVCRITSGTWASKPMDGQCHRKDTASATPLPRPFLGPGRGRPWSSLLLQRRGKGEMVR